jgi:hypothetical protein
MSILGKIINPCETPPDRPRAHRQRDVLTKYYAHRYFFGQRRDLKKTKGGKESMAKYGKKASEKVEKAMHERKEGKLKSGKSGKKVTSKKQAIAIGLSEAREAGGKVPKKKSSSKKSSSKKSSSKKKSSKKKSS